MISRPCGLKSFMGISRPWSRNLCSMYVVRGEILGEMLSNFSGSKYGDLGKLRVSRLILSIRNRDRYSWYQSKARRGLSR